MSDSEQAVGSALEGRRVLVVEDEPFIAFDIADAIEAAGGVVLGPAMSVRAALKLIEHTNVEAAILDVNLPDGDVAPVVAALASRGVFLLIHTGAGLTHELRSHYPSLRVFAKPTPPPLLALVIAGSMRADRDSRFP